MFIKKTILASAAAVILSVSLPIDINNEYKLKTSQVSASTVSAHSEFFQSYGPIASKVADESDLYASVMLAQMALESNFGKSGLSRSPVNNLFGIKGYYNGQSIQIATKEDDGNGNLYEIVANFRKYPSPEESMKDYARLLNTKTYTGVNKSASGSYEDVTIRLQGTYASDTKYASKLNYIIQTYNLTQFDKNDGIDIEGSPLFEEHKKVLSKAKFEEYTVQYGDTLFEIAEANGIPLEQLYLFNKLNSDLILVGQVLKTKEIIPAYESYEIKEGDSLKAISEKFETTEDYLVEVNELESNVIRTGKTIKVPHKKVEEKIEKEIKTKDEIENELENHFKLEDEYRMENPFELKFVELS